MGEGRKTAVNDCEPTLTGASNEQQLLGKHTFGTAITARTAAAIIIFIPH